MSTSLKKLMEQDAARPVSPAPIDDVLSGGQARLRRRRVLAVAAAVVLAVLAIAVPIGLAGDDSSVNEPVMPLERSDSLTFTREDGTSFTLDGARVRCPLPSQTETAGQAIVVIARGAGSAYFYLQAPLEDMADGATIELPATMEHEYDGTTYGAAHLFVSDGVNGNELSSSGEEAHGTIGFESASCDPVPAVDVRIDATLDSEFGDGEPVRVHGRLTVGDGT